MLFSPHVNSYSRGGGGWRKAPSLPPTPGHETGCTHIHIIILQMFEHSTVNDVYKFSTRANFVVTMHIGMK